MEIIRVSWFLFNPWSSSGHSGYYFSLLPVRWKTEKEGYNLQIGDRLTKSFTTRHLVPCSILILFSLIVGATLPLLLKDSNWIFAWLASSLVMLAAALLLYATWRLIGSNRTLGWFLAGAFLIRIIVGVITQVGLPVWGFDEPVQKSGYFFYDAYKRDNDAWALAQIRSVSPDCIWK